jgi:1-deoxy-D-xylulose-5-phosphate reductoisomerase
VSASSNGNMAKNIAIIGSTGSIGVQTLDVIESQPTHYKIVALACDSNIKLLKEQINKFHPVIAVVYSPSAACQLQADLNKKQGSKKTELGVTKILCGPRGLKKLATLASADQIVFAANGTKSLSALYAAINAKKQIAIANKELLVTAGDKIMAAARRNGVEIIPIDSEHSAIFQCLRGERAAEVEKVILTCSGGPFHGKTNLDFKKITAREALNHPVWKMGADISLDSATLMNKCFEIIEAAYLFNLKPEQIEVVIHPEGAVHSMARFRDGTIKAQLSAPDMRHHIAFALSYPKRHALSLPRLNLLELKKLTFFAPDFQRFEGPLFAYDLLNRLSNARFSGGVKKEAKQKSIVSPQNFTNFKGADLIRANSKAKKLFLAGKISFADIYPTIKKILHIT